MADPRFQPAPTVHNEPTEHRRRLANTINQAQAGKLNAVNDLFTLGASVASTDLEDPRLGYDSVVIFDPLTANAAAELAAGTLYALLADRGDETWTFTHANNAQTDRDYRVLILG